MSVPARFWALAQDTKGSERQVLNCLADWMVGNDAVVCWPSVETIAFETGCNRQTVMKATASLKQAGLITKKRRLVNDEWRMHYTLVGYVPSEWVNTERPTFESTENRKYEKPDLQDSVRTGNSTSESQKNRTSESTAFRTLESTENRTRTGNNKERNKERFMRTSGNSSATAAVASAQAQTPYPEDFDQSLFEEAQREAQIAGSKPNTVKAEAPKHRTTTPRKKPATRCPFDAEVLIPDDYRQIAEKAGIGDPQRVFSAFVNHALAHDRRLVIWPAGFRTWCSNEIRYHPNQTPKPKPLHQRTADDYNW